MQPLATNRWNLYRWGESAIAAWILSPSLRAHVLTQAKWSWVVVTEKEMDILDQPTLRLRIGHQCHHPVEGRAISWPQISCPHPNRTHSKSIGLLYQPKKMTFPEPLSRVELFLLFRKWSSKRRHTWIPVCLARDVKQFRTRFPG